MKEETEEREIRAALKKLQAGYAKRDLDNLDEYVGLVHPDLEIVGTGGVAPGDGDWPLGAEKSLALMKEDWEQWGDLTLHLNDARIALMEDGKTALASVTGVLKGVRSRKELIEAEGDYQADIFSKGGLDEDALFQSATEMLDLLRELRENEGLAWKLRLTAVLVKIEGRWLFRRMHFSYPTTAFPSVKA